MGQVVSVVSVWVQLLLCRVCSICQTAEHKVLYAGLFVQSPPSSAFFLLN